MATHSVERIRLTSLPSGNPVETTVHTYDGDSSGPTVYLQAAQHGREVNGIAVLRRLHEILPAQSLAGRVVAIPVADPLTHDRASYTTPEALDSVNPNMNRVWPGDVDGTLHERMAADLWSFVTAADAVIDLHTGSRAMQTHVVFMEGADGAGSLARAFGTELLLSEPAGDAADSEWRNRDFGGKLRVAATDAGIPAITPELAHNRAIVEDAVETGVTGVLNVLAELGVRDSAPEPNGDPVLARNHLGRVTASQSGLFRPAQSRSVGETVSSGDALGTVYNPVTYEALQEAVTDRDGVLYSLNREAIVTAGATLGKVAEPR